MSERYRRNGGRDVGVLFGSGLALWVVWVASTLPGYLVGAFIPDPRRVGLDLLMPIFFSAMLVPLWKSQPALRAWLVAGAVALLVHALLPGYAFIVAGAVAGALTGALFE